jgi:hypothetical protein
LPDGESEIFFRKGLDRGRAKQPLGQIRGGLVPDEYQQTPQKAPLACESTIHPFTNTQVVLCGVDHRHDQGWRAIINLSQEVPMSYSENDRKRELECLRLASDLTRLATDTLNPDLKAHCLRMAKIWTEQADHRLINTVQSASYH